MLYQLSYASKNLPAYRDKEKTLAQTELCLQARDNSITYEFTGEDCKVNRTHPPSGGML